MMGQLLRSGEALAMLPLLQTKLNVPGLHHRNGRAGYVQRQRLLEKLNNGFGKKLTLVCAPAGFGKSTLLGEWVRQPADTPTVAWLSLDISDNEPLRFWSYFIAALQRVDAEIGVTATPLLQSPHSFAPEILVTSLLNEITARTKRLALVLDDYHVIHLPAIHKALLFLLDHLQPQALDLSIADIHALESHTEGWVAGLQLAAALLVALITGPHLKSRRAVITQRSSGWATPGKQ
jgi:LuxR family maltose regulon positive regulatory protein